MKIKIIIGGKYTLRNKPDVKYAEIICGDKYGAFNSKYHYISMNSVPLFGHIYNEDGSIYGHACDSDAGIVGEYKETTISAHISLPVLIEQEAHNCEYVNVSFVGIKMACKHCGKEKV